MLKAIFYFFLFIVSVLFISWTLKWISAPTQVFSVENVKSQWQFAYDYDESLQSIARQTCTAIKALNMAGSENEIMQRRSQAMAYEQNYARVQAQYNARLRDNFRAGLVAPPDVPDKAPELADALLEINCK